MRIHRVALSNYRGVTSREISLSDRGVTVLEGPNEVGKSSIAEAVGLLLKYQDTSKHSDVKAVIPVDIDADPEVEADLVTGPYRVTYRKRWGRRPATTLKVTEPAPENLAGRDAHERMEEILDETFDRDLWDALRFAQGTGIAQAELSENRTLREALDAAAGGGTAGPGNDTLWALIEAERSQYFTAGGKPRGPRQDLAAAVEAATVARDDIAQSLRELEHDSERLQALSADLREEEKALPARKQEVADLEGKAQEAAAAQEAASRLGRAAQDAQRDLADAERATAERGALAASAEGAQAAAAAAIEAELAARTAWKAADEAYGQALEVRNSLRQAAENEAVKARLAAADAAHFRGRESLTDLEDRLTRARTADERLAVAAAELDDNPVDAALACKIDNAESAAVKARAELAAQLPPVTVTALENVTVTIDGDERNLTVASAPVRCTGVGGDIVIDIAGLARVTVEAGSQARAARESLEAAEKALAELFAAAGVGGDEPLAAVRTRAKAREQATEGRDRFREDLDMALRGETLAVLAAEVARAAADVETYPQSRPVGLPMPESLAAATRAAEAAGTTAEAAQEKARAAEVALAGPEQERLVARAAASTAAAQAEGARQVAARVAAELAAAREQTSDVDLADREASLRSAANKCDDAAAVAQAELEAADPDTARTLLANAEQALDGMKDRIQTARVDISKLTGSLTARGEQGLQSKLDRAETALEDAEREKARSDRAANAANMLYRVMNSRREEAQHRYVGPFKEQVERLGRIVFGPDFSVEIDPADLAVSARTLHGVTVDYKALSTGTREQICVLSRLACAALVNPDRGDGLDVGAPVVIDDAFAYSDPVRLSRLGAVLRTAGQSSQVIVLTCQPDRYRNVGGATVVPLDPQDLARSMPVVAAATRTYSGPAGPSSSDPVPVGDAEAAIVGVLTESHAPVGKHELLGLAGVGEDQWKSAIESLLNSGAVIREGAKRGTKYRLAGDSEPPR